MLQSPQHICLAEFPSWREVRHLGSGEMLPLGACFVKSAWILCGAKIMAERDSEWSHREGLIPQSLSDKVPGFP